MEKLGSAFKLSFNLLAAFVIFSLALAGLGRYAYSVSRYFGASDWKRADAVVESWHVESVRASDKGGRHTDYYGYPNYVYSIEGKYYVGYAVNLVDDRPRGTKQQARDLLTRYPIGHIISVYVNPDNPYDAVLNIERKPTIITVLWSTAVILLLLGLLTLPFAFIDSKALVSVVLVLCLVRTVWVFAGFEGIATAEDYPARSEVNPLEAISSEIGESRTRWKKYSKDDVIEDPAALYKELLGEEAEFAQPEGGDVTFLHERERPRWERSPILSLKRGPEGWRIVKIVAPYYR